MKFALGAILLLLVVIVANLSPDSRPDPLHRAGEVPQRLANP
ncbi:MAG: hypothetical protein AAF821_26430 [Cyanobacteria bacterium P01_D01_bin.156]